MRSNRGTEVNQQIMKEQAGSAFSSPQGFCSIFSVSLCLCGDNFLSYTVKFNNVFSLVSTSLRKSTINDVTNLLEKSFGFYHG